MNRRTIRFGLLVLAAIVYAVLQWQEGREPEPSRAGRGSVEEAWAKRVSDVWVEVEGRVDRVLPDDRSGSRHQRFILELSTGHTLLVAHNIDLAQRVPLAVGDRVSAYGEYEWNERGGVLHWTHHDPQGRHPGGWIRHRDRTYD